MSEILNTLSEVTQYEQSRESDTSEALEDLITSNTNRNSQLDSLQISNIGTGLFGDSPFSATSGKLNNLIGFDRINQSFKTILRTILGEVPMLPILGSQLNNLLFEPIDEILDDTLELVITDALGKLEPRVKILTTVISHDNRDQNMINIEVEYQLTNTNIVYVFRDSIVSGNGGDVI